MSIVEWPFIWGRKGEAAAGMGGRGAAGEKSVISSGGEYDYSEISAKTSSVADG